MEARTPGPAAILVFPAGREKLLAKAVALDAGAVVLDLEDAVAPEAKGQARAALAEAMGAFPSSVKVGVRVNGLATEWGEADLAEIGGLWRQPDHVVVPKVESPDDLTAAAAVAGELGLHALIESARGLARVDEVAAHPACAGLVLGYADLSVSLRRPWPVVDDPGAWAGAQDAVVLAARAHGVAAIDGPLLVLDDADAVEAAGRWARGRGFEAKWAIHPGQLAPIERAFAPADAELEWARGVMAAAGGGAARAGAQMVDEPVVAAAQTLLARAGEPA